jgi:hypothetical protein
MLRATETPAIWLIHGTWARGARWTEHDSPLRSALQSQFGGPVEVSAFNWTGRNTTRDRAAATSQFSAAVHGAGHSRPRFAIAHSHGGNIALQAALTDSTLFDGIVTLNTPFLAAIPRSNTVVVLNLCLVQFALFAIALNGLQAILGRALTMGEHLLLLAVLGPLLVAAGVMLLVGYRRRESGVVVTGFGRNVVSYHGGAQPRVLCITYADDEAMGWLGTLDTLSSLPGLFLHRIALPVTLLGVAALHYLFAWQLSGPVVALNIQGLMSEYGATFGAVAATDFVSRLGLQLTPDDVAELSSFVWTFSSGRLFAIVFTQSVLSYFVTLWALVGLSAFLSAYLIRGVAFGEGFGVPAIASALITKLAVSATPMVPCRLDVVFVNEEHSRWLRHSDAYGNPVVMTEILDWMRAGSPRLERDVAHTSPSTG